MGKIVIYALAVLFGLIIGPLSILPALSSSSQVNVSGWTSNWSVGSAQANPYVRAYVSIYGLLALTKEEAVYFINGADTDGEDLREDCVYSLTGGDQPAEWWSITLYDKDGYLPLNEDNSLSMDATRAGGEDWSVIISPNRPDNADAIWVSSRNSEIFDLTLRLYKPSADMLERPESELNPPRIERVSCTGDAS